MLFQNVIRHTIYLLAEAERDAALQQRLRGEVGGADRISNAPASHRVAIHRSHARNSVSTPNSAGNHSQQPPPEL